ncbi:hypothetical protein JCM8547_006153 [Rhodosporidiobolus lusitaniae]
MSTSTAKTARTADVGTSVRARSKPTPSASSANKDDDKRKTVYRTVLDNPLSITWPPLPATTRKVILDELVTLISQSKTEDGKSVADWRLDEHARRRGNTRGAGKEKREGKEKEGETDDAAKEVFLTSPAKPARDTHTLTTRSGQTHSIPTSIPPPSSSASSQPISPSAHPPALLSHLLVGINEVTRALESRIRWGRWELGDRSAAPPLFVPRHEEPLRGPGRHRRRKPSSSGKTPSALSPDSKRLVPPPSVGSLPEYAFARKKAPKVSGEEVPPYLVEDGQGGVRMLVNSDARRLRAELHKQKDKEVDGGKGKAKETSTTTSADPSSTLVPTAASSTPNSIPPSSSPSTVSIASTVPLIDLIFVCKPDINPPSLVAHLPTMVAAANGVQEALDSVLAGQGADKAEGMDIEGEGSEEKKERKRPEMRKVVLIPLDVGAEKKLAEVLGLRRVAAIGISSSFPAASALLSLITSPISPHSRLLTPLNAPWLVPHVLHPPSLPRTNPPPPEPTSGADVFLPTAIKHLKTTAPLNPKAANVEKKKRRRERKEGEKEERRKAKRRKMAEEGGGKQAKGTGEVYEAED